jgi:Flp pilus assembly protein TadB
MSSDPDQRRRRESLLVVFFTISALLFVLFFVMLLTGPLFLYILVTLVFVAGLIGVNYLLWGRSMEQQTAGEREEAELREQMEAPEWDEPHPRGRHHH